MSDYYQKNYKAYAEKLTQSILAKAFRGELAPQDPSDPSAKEAVQAALSFAAKALRPWIIRIRQNIWVW